MIKKKGSTKEEKVVATKRKSMGLKALLSSELKGHKIAGIVKMFGEVEILNGAEKQTVFNKVSKVGLRLRDKTDEEVMADETLVNAMKIVSKEFGTLKDAMKQKDVKLSKEMNDVYKALISYGKKDKNEYLPDSFEF